MISALSNHLLQTRSHDTFTYAFSFHPVVYGCLKIVNTQFTFNKSTMCCYKHRQLYSQFITFFKESGNATESNICLKIVYLTIKVFIFYSHTRSLNSLCKMSDRVNRSFSLRELKKWLEGLRGILPTFFFKKRRHFIRRLFS